MVVGRAAASRRQQRGDLSALRRVYGDRSRQRSVFSRPLKRMPALADVIPAYIEVVTILVDDNEAGRINANKLAARLHAKGIQVLLATTGSAE